MCPIKEEFQRYNMYTGDNYGAKEVKTFEPEENLKSDMFEESGLMQPMKQIYFDVPQLFQ